MPVQTPSCVAFPRVLGVVLIAVLSLAGVAAATGYQVPDKVLVDMVDAPPTPEAMMVPDRKRLLLLERRSLVSIDELAAPELRLAGLRIDPSADAPSRGRGYAGLSLVQIADGATRAVEGLPPGARIDHVSFSPDGAHVAFALQDDPARGWTLWTANLAQARARRVTSEPLHLAARIEPMWLADSQHVVAAWVPTDRPAAPKAPSVPAGPVVRENLGTKAAARTYQDLLSNPHDEALFTHHMRAQIGVVSLDGTLERVAQPGVLWHLDPSPDGLFFAAEWIESPYSYLVPASRFPRRIEVLDRAGASVRVIAELPLQEAVPTAFGSVPIGPRDLTWRADAPSTLMWVEALDEGDAGAEAELRDQLMLLTAPFKAAPTRWAALRHRFGGVQWGRDDLALVDEWWWKTRATRTLRLRPDQPDAPAEVLVERSFEDRYSDPGTPIEVANDRGRSVLLLEGDTFFRVGGGASPEGDRPFLDAFDVARGVNQRLFHSQAPYYEVPLMPLPSPGEAPASALTRRESVDDPPNYGVRSLTDPSADARMITSFEHPTPALRGLSKELISYQRDDGVQLTGTLYLPPGYAPEQGPLPLVMWAYPQEFKSAAAAGQVNDSPYRFTRLAWWASQIWLARGYAVLDDPAMPIIGEGDKEPNDTFRTQLVSSAAAAIDEVVRRGVADRDRIAIGGHSYGAFMTANLLAHSDLFAAGIARSGAYNRTLTPFGFQAEQRTYWEAPEIYNAMSPFMHADKVDEPLLMIHGEADNNSGTFPIQSERFYHALKGHGAVARLVMLPHESHGYRARESILHMMYETDAWLETYVKHPSTTPVVEGGEGPRGAAR